MNDTAIDAYTRVSTTSHEERDRLVTEYLPLVHHVLGRLPIHLPTTLDRDDLFAVGVLGLMQAAETYDSSRGAKFKTHAFVNVRGAILDELRRHDVVPRSRRDRLRLVGSTERELEEHLGRAPTPEEIAQATGLSISQVENVLVHAHGINVLSLEDKVSGDDSGEGCLMDCLRLPGCQDPADEAALHELKEQLAGEILELPERERRVIVLYYSEDLRLKEIGEILGITESRVSQLHSKALYRLNRALKSRVSGIPGS